MTQTRWEEPRQDTPKSSALGHPVWALLGIAANAAGVASFLANPAPLITAFIAVAAVLLGTMLLWTSFGKPVGVKVILAVVVIVVGAVLLSMIITRSALPAPGGPKPGAAQSPSTSTSRNEAPVTSAPPTSSPSSPAPADPAQAGISRSTGDQPIVITDGYVLDIDSQEHYWVAKPSEEVTGEDLNFSSSYLTADEDLATATAEATLDDCVRAGYHPYAESDGLTTGSAFCVKTTGGTYARVIVRDRQNSQLTLDVVVWEKPS